MEIINDISSVIKPTKLCLTCNKEYDIKEFLAETSRNKDKCIACRKDVFSAQYKKRKEYKSDLVSKMCNYCNKELPIELFKPQQNKCIECANARRRELRALEKPKKEIIIVAEGNKYCKYCRTEKLQTMFRHNRLKCLDCERTDGRVYRQSDIGKTKAKTWALTNSEKMKHLQANWFQDNKDKIYEKIRKRYEEDIVFKIRMVCSTRLCHAIKKNGKTLIDFLGCSAYFLKGWFSVNYDNNMNDNNHGSYWHIDHVIPIATFKNLDTNETERHLCLSWFNLSPLKASENLSKNKSIDKVQLKRHIDNLKIFVSGLNIDISLYEQLCAKHLDAGNSLESSTTTS